MRKGITLLCLCLAIWVTARSQVAINTDGTNPAASAMLDVKSTTKGLLVPRMTTVQRNAIASATPGLLVYDTDTESFWFRRVVTVNNFPFYSWQEISYGQGLNVWEVTGGTTHTSTANRRVGIGGVTTAQGNLHVGDIDGPSVVTIGRSYSAGGYTAMSLGTSALSNGYNYIQSVRAAGAANGYGNLVLNPVAGNIGIGVANPTAKLHVNGNVLATNARVTTDFSAGPNDALRVRLDGRVSVGAKAAEGYWFSVNGRMICEEIRVQLSSTWPDYVFENNYSLRTFDELRSFISNNKHLPNIPPAATIQKEGLDVGDMQKRSIEKIEELTLYILQLEERIKKLEGSAK